MDNNRTYKYLDHRLGFFAGGIPHPPFTESIAEQVRNLDQLLPPFSESIKWDERRDGYVAEIIIDFPKTRLSFLSTALEATGPEELTGLTEKADGRDSSRYHDTKAAARATALLHALEFLDGQEGPDGDYTQLHQYYTFTS